MVAHMIYLATMECIKERMKWNARIAIMNMNLIGVVQKIPIQKRWINMESSIVSQYHLNGMVECSLNQNGQMYADVQNVQKFLWKINMTDKEKIEWFDKTMDWIDQFGGSKEALEFNDCSSDASNDLFVNVVEQYKKVTGKWN